MAKPILMPQVGQDIATGYIGEWFIKPGDLVQKGDVIATVESEKAVFEVEAYDAGTVLKLLYEPGAEVKVLEPIAYLGEAGENTESYEAAAAVTESVEEGSLVPIEPTIETPAAETDSRLLASPSARRLAREHGVELAQITGSGPGGRIIKRDVLAMVNRQPASQPAGEVTTEGVSASRELPFSRLRQIMSERLRHSKQTIPHFYLFIDVDLTAALAWRAATNQKLISKISVNDIMIKATGLALLQFPRLNSHILPDKIIQYEEVNIGVAVSVEDGLLVPVIPAVNQKSLEEISQTARENAETARQGRFKTANSATFTISNLGMYAMKAFLPIINPPECAILGVGKAEKRVVPLNENAIGIREMVTLSLAVDHRAVDGQYAAQFLNLLKANLENCNFH